MNSEKTTYIIGIIGICFIIITFIIVVILSSESNKNNLYKQGIECFENKNWTCVIEKFEKLKYKDSAEKLNIAKYEYDLSLAENFLTKKDYSNAIKHYSSASLINSANKELNIKIENLKVLQKEQNKIEEKNKKKREEENRKNAIKAKISDTAIYPIPTKFGEGYDETIRRYGIVTIKRINKLAPQAAELVAQNPKCTRVMAIDVADDKSTRNSITFFADCGDINHIRDIQRFYVNEKEINANVIPKSVKEQAETIDKGQYLLWCESEIKARLNFPSTYKANILMSNVNIAPMGTVVTIRFKAKNGYNLETKNVGTCHYQGSILSDVSINEEQ